MFATAKAPTGNGASFLNIANPWISGRFGEKPVDGPLG
jgi:hypothetical protein